MERRLSPRVASAADGEAGGYYEDYGPDPRWHLARVLGSGFAYQGEPSRHRHDRTRGEASGSLSPLAFVNFLQTTTRSATVR
jgi:1,4-alpha-glucan branching enzyme/maltooligosyltrehalose trehalohydrolase